GMVSDQCRGMIDCGECREPGKTCGGGGKANKCGCTPTTCAASGANCGMVPDGCGGMIDCKTCASPAVCGGCGKIIDCGNPCQPPRSCGGGGMEHKCGCKSTTCAMQGKDCGMISDGCG